MGRWTEVHCACADRIPLPRSGSQHEPYGGKKHLSGRERMEREEWKATTRHMYACGHRNGVLVEFWPGSILRLGALIRSIFGDESDTFEILVRISDWSRYEDELLLLTPDEASLLRMEVAELQRALDGSRDLPRNRVEKLISEFLRAEMELRLTLADRIERVGVRVPFARVVLLMQNVLASQQPDTEAAHQTIKDALANTEALCRASIATDNPIRMLW